MSTLTLPQSRIPIGWVTVQGQRMPVEVDIEWSRYFFTLTDRAGGVTAPTNLYTTISESPKVVLDGAEDGERGPMGPTGLQGPPGSAGISISGMDGEDGDAGPIGPTGMQGPMGIPGLSIRGMDGEDGESMPYFHPGLTGLGAGVATFLGTPSSANLASAVTDETGSGSLVFATSPTLTTPKATTTIGVGNTTPSASGAGISFPSTQSASTDANTLDDYEEGTFTANLSDGVTSVALNSSGRYTKIGRYVHVYVVGYNQDFSSLGAATALKITGLPFTNAAYKLESFNTHNTNAAPVCSVSLEVGNTEANLVLMTGTIDTVAATRNNLVGGAATFSIRGSFSYEV